MRREKVFSVVFLSLVLWVSVCLRFVTIADVKAQSYGTGVGVKVGDWARYGDILIDWNSTNPDATPDQELLDLNNTEWFENIVTEINSSQVFFEHVTQFKDGTNETDVLQVNVNSGTGNGTIFFILGGLFSSDMVYPESEESSPAFINTTALRVCAGVTRLVNHLNLTNIQLGEAYTNQSITVSLNYYWDRDTGIVTERSGSGTSNTGGYNTSWTRSDRIVGTNVWSGEETKPPKADAGGNRTVNVGSPVVFDASASRDNTGIVSYSWLFGDGTADDGVKVTHTYSENGTYYSVLIVKDASGNMGFDAVTVTVEPESENGVVEPPPQNGFRFDAIATMAVIAVIVATAWILQSRRKRRIKPRVRHRALSELC